MRANTVAMLQLKTSNMTSFALGILCVKQQLSYHRSIRLKELCDGLKQVGTIKLE